MSTLDFEAALSAAAVLATAGTAALIGQCRRRWSARRVRAYPRSRLDDRHRSSRADTNEIEAATTLRMLDRRWLMRTQMDAFVVLTFAGALRGGESRAMRVRDWKHRVESAGVTVLLPLSKADQTREGEEIAVPYDFGGAGVLRPVALVDRWIEAAGLGPDDVLFTNLRGVGRSARSIDTAAPPISPQVLIGRLARLSSDADLSRRLTGHSARRGFATYAANAGIPLHEIQRQTRHKRLETLSLYIERTAAAIHGRGVADGVVCALLS